MRSPSLLLDPHLYVVRHRVLRGLTLALILTVAVAAVTVFARLAAGDDLVRALRSASALEFRRLVGPAGMDSWAAMLAASYRVGLGDSLYASVLLLDNCKYQYPPAALLLMEMLPHPGGPFVCSADAHLSATLEPRSWSIKPWIDLSSQLAWLATLWITARLLLRWLTPPARLATRAAWERAALYGLVGLLGLAFYPLVWSHTLGQIQIYLNLMIVTAVWAAVAGRGVLAGVLIGTCCLFKPQYVVLLIWALLRREWRIGGGIAFVTAAGTAVALARYGAAVHLEYLDFLRGVGALGESYGANQSFNGLMHRWIEPASGRVWADSTFGSSAHTALLPPAFDWKAAGFPSHYASVHATTVFTSLAILGVVLWPVPAATCGMQRALDLGLTVGACTLASPIAWWHHYGVFFALFALALVALARSPVQGRPALMAALAVAYVCLGSALLRPELVFGSVTSALMGSHGLFGALLLLGVMWTLRARSAELASGDASAHRFVVAPVVPVAAAAAVETAPASM